MKVQKSFRLAEEVVSQLEKWKGETLTDKFENLIWFCFQEEPNIDRRIKAKKAELQRLEKKINSYQNIENDLESIKRYVDIAQNYCKRKVDG